MTTDRTSMDVTPSELETVKDVQEVLNEENERYVRQGEAMAHACREWLQAREGEQ